MTDLLAEYAARRPKSLALFERARRSLAGAVGHDLRYALPAPIYIERGQGGRKRDIDGNEYVDFLMGNGALLLGHADPEVVEAIARAASLGTHFGNDHPLHIEWAELVQTLIPCAERVRFTNSGTEATLLAIRIARAATGRSRLLRFAGHFHGWHDDVVHGFHPPFDADGSLGVPPHVREGLVTIPDGNLNLVDETLAANPDIAAVILEPSGASWGRVPIDVEWLRGVREATARRGVLLIFDEVVTGFRFSAGGAQKLYGVTPDLCCLAKVMAGGMPGGAVAGREAVMRVFDMTGDPHHDRHQRVVHFGTFNAAPPSAAAGIAVLRRVADGTAIAAANDAAARLRSAWDDVLERRGIAGYVYGSASTYHVYFETDPGRVREANRRSDLHTTEAGRLKGMSGRLIARYQLRMRSAGVDNMSSTGGVTCAAHSPADVEAATIAFEQTVIALRDEGLVLPLA
ncbi:MAG: aminotransferase class III-fold pyridoxal phosphate-dependent enzyme [Planctomycetaceae bacterium]|nr:aminotransferase class III-fold pyridoxal phosphate-dependent enzyme [Planctomycetaceae bacterium]